MLQKVIKTVERYGMFEGTGDVTVALSGGADSVCLLLALCELKERYGLKISAVHVNHQLRGAESDRDEAFVRRLCDSRNVPLTVKRVDVKTAAGQTGESIELAARNIRYRIFKECADGVVATAHSADDNLETVIYNMTRGSGIKGLCGIPPKRDIFVRPLILCTRTEIEEFLAGHKTDFVTDSTNLSDCYTRNRIRHSVTPVLKGINPSVCSTVATMCENLRQDEDFLAQTARRIYTVCLRGDGLDSEILKINHPSVIKRVIALYLYEEHGHTTDALHLENCYNTLLSGGRAGLSAGFYVVCKNGRFFAAKGDKRPEPETYSVEIKYFPVDNDNKINNLFLKNTIDCGKISGSLTVRCRQPSDEIRLKGRGCTKSLKKLFCELKIPAELRDTLPVAADEKGVVWICGIGVSERVAFGPETKNAAQFVVSTINKT